MRQQRKIKPITPKYLDNVAAYYLQRYAASKESLRRVLLRRIKKASSLDPDAVPEWREWAEKVIQRYEKDGALDDRRYAGNRVQSLRRKGGSKKVIWQKLLQKGIAKEDIAGALSEGDEDSEWQALIRFLQRKKIGPYRKSETFDAKKELMVLARAGFDYTLIQKILKKTRAELEQEEIYGT